MPGMAHPQHLPDPVAGHWLTEYLTELDGSVGQVVPAVYEAYVRGLDPRPNLGAPRPDQVPGAR